MRVSVSIEVVMELAIRETIAANFKEVEPDHLLMALLKFSELSSPQGNEIGGDHKGSAQTIASDISTLSKEIASHSIDSTKVRRALRSMVGHGNFKHGGEVAHRSDQTRRIFDQAVILAENKGDVTLCPSHLFTALLEFPTPAMLKVLGKSQQLTPMPKVQTLRLDEDGEDLSRVTRKEDIAPNEAVYLNVLLSVLSLRTLFCVFFVCERDEFVRSISIAAASKCGSEDSPPNLKGKRVIDISKSKKFVTHRKEWIRQIFDEVSKSRDIILLLPPITSRLSDISAWLASLQLYLTSLKVQVICRTTPEICKKHLQNDTSWKRISHIIWVDETKETIPTTL